MLLPRIPTQDMLKMLLPRIPTQDEMNERAMNKAIEDNLKSQLEAQRAKLEIAIKALEYYAEHEVYIKPDDWCCLKEGGQPELDDCEICSDIAQNALSKIRVAEGQTRGAQDSV